jgi:hypothetical protein
MSRTYHHGKNRRVRGQSVHRSTGLRRLARALIEQEYQQAMAEAEAKAEHHQQAKPAKRRRKGQA